VACCHYAIHFRTNGRCVGYKVFQIFMAMVFEPIHKFLPAGFLSLPAFLFEDEACDNT